MYIIRKIGMYLSLAIIATASAVRYFLSSADQPISGVRIILIENRKVLLVSHWYAPGVWTLPGGGVDRGETPEHAAIREVKEEVGFTVHSLAGEIGQYRGRWGRGDMIAVYYTGDFDGSLTLTPNLEIMARSWFEIDNLPEEISPANRRRIEAYRAGVRNETGRW